MKKSGDRSTPAVSPATTFTPGICRFCGCRGNKCKTPEGQKGWRLCVWQDKEHTRCSGSRCVLKWQKEQSALSAQKKKKESERLVRAFDHAHRAAAGLTRAFGIGDVPAIDAVIMRQLSSAFASIDDVLQDACLQRGLLPRQIGESLRMARFLAVTLPLARAAQAETRIPASILIAEAYAISGPVFYGCRFELERPESNDIFNTGETFTSLREAFLQRARWLSQQLPFQPIMRATGDRAMGMTSANYPPNFLVLIAAWSKAAYGNDLVATIRDHSLLECDRMLPAV